MSLQEGQLLWATKTSVNTFPPDIFWQSGTKAFGTMLQHQNRNLVLRKPEFCKNTENSEESGIEKETHILTCILM